MVHLRILSLCLCLSLPHPYIASLPGEHADLSKFSGEIVVKPTISAGSVNTGRYDLTQPEHVAQAKELIEKLGNDGKTVMLQPYLKTVDTHGETGCVSVCV